jgi:hypothetical protein
MGRSHLSDEVSHHQEVYSVFFVRTGVDRKVFQVKVADFILEKAHFAPGFELLLRVLPVQEVKPIFIVNFKVTAVDLDLLLVLSLPNFTEYL